MHLMVISNLTPNAQLKPQPNEVTVAQTTRASRTVKILSKYDAFIKLILKKNFKSVC